MLKIGLLLVSLAVIFAAVTTRTCASVFGILQFLSIPKLWSVCLNDGHASPKDGYVRWGLDEDVVGVGRLGTIWIKDATVLFIKNHQDSADIYLHYKNAGVTKYTRLNARGIVQIFSRTKNLEQGELVNTQNLKDQLPPGDVISIEMQFSRKGSKFSHEEYESYFKSRFSGDELTQRIDKIKDFGNAPTTNDLIELNLSRKFSSFDSAIVLVGKIVREQ